MNDHKIDTPQKLAVAVEAVLDKYDRLPEHTDFEQFVTQVLTESNAFPSAEVINTVAADIFTTIDLADAEFRALRAAKGQGKSAIVWLRDKIGKAIEALPDTEQNDVIRESKNALKRANSELFELLYDAEMPAELSAPLKSFDFKDLNATAITQNLKKDIENNTFLGAITVGEGFSLQVDTSHKEIKAVKDYFLSQLDAPEDREIKKVVTAAAEIAKQQGLKPLAGVSTTEVALIVDRGLTTAKLAYKLGSGDMSATDVSDYMIDRTASGVTVAITRTCQKISSGVGAAVGAAIGTIFGPTGAAAGTIIGRTAGYIAGTAVGTVIGRGVTAVATYTKKMVKSAWEGIKSVGNTIAEGVQNFGRRLADWFR